MPVVFHVLFVAVVVVFRDRPSPYHWLRSESRYRSYSLSTIKERRASTSQRNKLLTLRHVDHVFHSSRLGFVVEKDAHGGRIKAAISTSNWKKDN